MYFSWQDLTDFFFLILRKDTKESSVTYYLWLKLGKEVMLNLLNVLSLREEVARGPGSMLETAEDTNRKKPTPEDVLKSQITSSLTPLTSHPIVTSDKKFPDFHLDFLYLLVKNWCSTIVGKLYVPLLESSQKLTYVITALLSC